MENNDEKRDSRLKTESEQFLFLCSQKEVNSIEQLCKYEQSDDVVRLMFISLALGYRCLFLWLLANVRKDADSFLQEMERTNTDFNKIDGWMTDFIHNIEYEDARNFIGEYWEQIRQEIDPDVSVAKQLVMRVSGDNK